MSLLAVALATDAQQPAGELPRIGVLDRMCLSNGDRLKEGRIDRASAIMAEFVPLKVTVMGG